MTVQIKIVQFLSLFLYVSNAPSNVNCRESIIIINLRLGVKTRIFILPQKCNTLCFLSHLDSEFRHNTHTVGWLCLSHHKLVLHLNGHLVFTYSTPVSLLEPTCYFCQTLKLKEQSLKTVENRLTSLLSVVLR